MVCTERVVVEWTTVGPNAVAIDQVRECLVPTQTMDAFGRRMIQLSKDVVKLVRDGQGVMIPEGVYHHVGERDGDLWIYRRNP